MKEISKYDLKRLKPYEAVGKVCIDLTDLRTGKVIQREQGKNMVFPDTLYCGNNWITQLNDTSLVLNDDDTPVNKDMPYLLGGVIGYGKPSTAGSGLLLGSYNAANQVLAAKTINSIRWKFQYDFTGPQAIGTIKSIGLTKQYDGSVNQYTQDMFSAVTYEQNKGLWTGDGRYYYQCSTAGIIDKYDVYAGASTTIDVSAIVGTTAGEPKVVGYAPATGLYYIYVYSATPANRKMYVFTDATFTTSSANYSMSNSTYNPSYGTMYIYGDKAFFPISNKITKIDFVSDTAPVEQVPGKTWALINPAFNYKATFGYGKYIFKVGVSTDTGWIYDMSIEDIIGSSYSAFAGNAGFNSICINPVAQNFIPSVSYSAMFNNCAKTAKVLDTPVEKTSANGLTATYELEVFWDL